ncbi:MAG: DUF3006 domain-containing protein [Ruminococcus sp.]|uniref:DUF3006 domain-containing protein n=1 Tax=Ruminococcus sp. TaxID=41978 RepID=UPI0025FBF117|nr:DUF3006 domain-containing protein [Ruminococcus sp.]MCR5599766.1 DUF3006 domain-containing protein [Ruminococcus sp.]
MVIDRFEGCLAVIETENGMVTLRREQLPKEAAEGDVLVFADGRYTIDKKAAAERRSAVREKLKKLTNR